MRKISPLLLYLSVSIVIVVAGCSDNSGQQNGNIPAHKIGGASHGQVQRPKTVVVNKGMSKKEENKLNKRINELEKKVQAQDKKGSEGTTSQPAESSQPEPSQQQPEDQARAAAEAYYQAVEARDWSYTYDHLAPETQSAYTEQEWSAKNDYLANTGAVTYTIQYVVMDSSAPETVADVTVMLTAADGSTNVRNTYFVYEDGSWLHRFSPEEYDLLASAPTATASASSTATASASASTSSSSSPTSASAGSRGVPPVSQTDCPASAPIKGNAQSGIYHTPSSATYDETNPEKCFATEAAARAAGYRAAED